MLVDSSFFNGYPSRQQFLKTRQIVITSERDFISSNYGTSSISVSHSLLHNLCHHTINVIKSSLSIQWWTLVLHHTIIVHTILIVSTLDIDNSLSQYPASIGNSSHSLPDRTLSSSIHGPSLMGLMIGQGVRTQASLICYTDIYIR